MKRLFLACGGILGIPIIIIGVLLVVIFPNLYKHNPTELKGDLSSWIKDNYNNIYYAVFKSTNKNGVLTQYVRFYEYVNTYELGRQLVDISDVLAYNINKHYLYVNRNSELHHTWELKNFDTVELAEKISKKFGNKVTLVRIDKEDI